MITDRTVPDVMLIDLGFSLRLGFRLSLGWRLIGFEPEDIITVLVSDQLTMRVRRDPIGLMTL